MICGRYLTSMDPTEQAIALREAVFGTGRDEQDRLAVYALALDDKGNPAGAGRLHIDEDDQFSISFVGVPEPLRRQGLGDLVVRMLLQRALDLGAPRIVLDAPEDLTGFFARYGFAREGGTRMVATPGSIDRCGGCGGHCGAAAK